jgi:predicted RNA binding protein with dsRBD fold (UPF0201 family)
MPRVTIRARCFPTEDPVKVRQAILGLFPESEIEERESEFVAHTTSLDRLEEVIRNQRIRDSARAALFRGRSDNMVVVTLSKQVAFMGKVSFVEEYVPLGPIEVVIEDEDIEGVIDQVAASTVRREEAAV